MRDFGQNIPLVLKLENWPQADQEEWAQFFELADIFSDAGTFSHWSEGTKTKHHQGYGQWLSFLLRQFPEQLHLAPTARVTPELVRLFLAECEERLSPSSVSNLISDLFVMARGINPDRDWTWLGRLSLRLNRRADRLALRQRAPISARTIFDWSLKRMAEVEAQTQRPARTRAIRFRQALMIGFLISRPVRRRALLAMRIGEHLVRNGNGFILRFPAADMKDSRRHDFPLPDQLVDPMKRYLACHRLVLLAGGTSDGLWISQDGLPITRDGLSRELPKVTDRYLGVPLRPHRFRDIAATSVAEVDPEHVGIIRDILGHATLAMAQKHYNRASMISSCNALQTMMDDIRADGVKIRVVRSRTGE